MPESNSDLDSFPDFGRPTPPRATAPVHHSGDLGLEFPAEEQAGPLREQILSTPDDAGALDSRTEKHWSTRKRVIAAGIAVLAIAGGAFGIGKATSGGGEATPKPGAIGTPQPSPHTSEALAPETVVKVIAPNTTKEVPFSTTPASATETTPPETSNSTSSKTSEALSAEAQKYVIDMAAVGADPNGYFAKYAAQVGIRNVLLPQSAFKTLQQAASQSDAKGEGAVLGLSQNENLTSYMNALLINRDVSMTKLQRQALDAQMLHYTIDGGETGYSTNPLVVAINKYVDQHAADKPFLVKAEVSEVDSTPGNVACLLRLEIIDAATGKVDDSHHDDIYITYGPDTVSAVVPGDSEGDNMGLLFTANS